LLQTKQEYKNFKHSKTGFKNKKAKVFARTSGKKPINKPLKIRPPKQTAWAKS
jgi:hypothetical protein